MGWILRVDLGMLSFIDAKINVNGGVQVYRQKKDQQHVGLLKNGSYEWI